MADKSFNEQPMVVVVSDGLEPRIKRQLESQLQSTMMTISGLTAELENQKAVNNVKQQMDAVKDQSKFDEEKTEDTANPPAIENQDTEVKQDANSNPGTDDPFSDGAQQDTTQSADQGTQNPDGGGAPANAPSAQEQQTTESNPAPGSGGQAGNNQPSDNQSTTTNSPPAANATPEANATNGQNSNAGATTTNPPANAEQPATTGSNSSSQSGQTQDQANPAQNQPVQNQGQPSQPDSSSGADGGDDPFADNNGVSFESFAGILDLKLESTQTQTDDKLTPPIKMLVYVSATDAGVDNRTSTVVATIEDPENAVVVLDQSNLGDVEAKMQFKALTKQLQGRGIMVVDSIDSAVEFLNNVYDEMAGKTDAT